MFTYHLYWAPEGKRIATVKAKNAKAAIRQAPLPYRKYLGEIYAELDKVYDEQPQTLAA